MAGDTSLQVKAQQGVMINDMLQLLQTQFIFFPSSHY